MLLILIRTVILYSLVVATMRVMGKRQIGELQPFELAIAIMIAELASVPIQETSIPLINGIVPILSLLVLQLFISFISLKSIKAREFICGKPSILIQNGIINEDNLRKEVFTLDDLLEQLRINNMPNIADVEFAILETNGQLSIIPKSQKRALCPEDMNISTKYEGLPVEIIIDGKIIYKNLTAHHIDLNWVIQELKKNGVDNHSHVFFASLDSSGNLYFQLKRKHMYNLRKE